MSTQPPVYVDLDGTLVSTDLLWESLWLLLRRDPVCLFLLPFWLLRGRSGFKSEVALRVTLDASLLPYRPEVLRYLDEQRSEGRKLVLATASHERVARPIADEVGCFDTILATTPERNLRGATKLEAILEDCQGGDFEYLGDSVVDVPIWQKATIITLVAPSRGARAGVEGFAGRTQTLPLESEHRFPILRAMRIYQWVKNALLFVPILLAHELSDFERSRSVVIAFLCFCAVASATYMLNDLLDIESDRQHHRKKHRPFASGVLPIPRGLAVMSGLLIFGFATSGLLLTPMATGMLAIYTALTVSYSFYVKERLFVDVLMLAGLYTHRVLAGAVAAAVVVSPWLLAFSLFFFLSLALLKRYAELLAMQDRDGATLARRAYEVDDIGLVESMGTASGYLSVLVLCLFVSSDDVSRLYPTPELLWLGCPIFLYWIARMWFLARRRVLSDDPVLFAATDPASYVTGAALALVGVLAAM